MQFEEVLRRRRMVRNYDPMRPVPPDARERILTATLRAPSAGFTQGWDLLICETPAERADFWESTTPAGQGNTSWSQGMRRAPLVIVPLSHRDAYIERYAEPDKASQPQSWPVPYWDIDTGLATLIVLLSAVDSGLGACFFGIPAERLERFRTAFGVPGAHVPIGALTIGYPAPEEPSPSLRRPRRPLEEVAHRGHWQGRNS